MDEGGRMLSRFIAQDERRIEGQREVVSAYHREEFDETSAVELLIDLLRCRSCAWLR
jgi:hypothetical protein